jgi:hypothetical protein
VIDPFAVNPNAVHAVEVAYDKTVIDQCDTAMFSRDLSAVFEDDVAVRVPPDQKDRFIENNRAAALGWFEQNGHATSAFVTQRLGLMAPRFR